MNDLQRGVVTLLRSAITGESYPLPQGFSLEAALPIIKKHHMIPLAYTGAVNCGISVKDPVMQQLFQGYLRCLLQSERQMKAISRIQAAFEENGIDYMPLKGCNMKSRYPKSELRIMGDADILIRLEQYDRIRQIMPTLGFTEGKESDHELVWDSPDLHLELHKQLVPPNIPDHYAYFGIGWDLAVSGEGHRRAMCPEDEFLFLFAHFARHYRSAGIGCRHVVDLWVFLRAFPELDRRKLEAGLEKLRLTAFWANMRRLLSVWFEDAEPDEKTDFISEFIFSSGSWGQIESQLLSLEAVRAREAGSVKAGRWQRLRNAVFPPAAIISYRYPVLKKAPWLLPVIWVVRWFDALLFRRDNIRVQHREIRTTTEKKVEAKLRALDYVGLDF